MSDDGESEEEFVEEHEFEAEGWDDIPTDPEEVSKLLLGLRGAVPDVVREAMTAGLDGLSSSEERIRDAIPENEVTGEALAYLLEHADSFKREFFRVLSRELRDALEEMDFGGELAKVLTRLSLEAQLTVRFRENEDADGDDAVEPNASGRVRVENNDEDDSGDDS